MYYSALYSAVESKMDPNRAFRNRELAEAFDLAEATHALNLLGGDLSGRNLPPRDSLLWRAIVFLGHYLDDLPEPDAEESAPVSEPPAIAAE